MEKSRNNNSRRLMAIIAVVLMVCLILAMGAVTFAKYITSGTTGDQTATAAKWGFVVSVDANNLFGKNYSVSDGSALATVTTDGVAVKATGDANVVAPGTKGSMTFSIKGSAETLAKLTINVGAVSGDSVQEIHIGDEYYPVKWTLTKTTKTTDLRNETAETLVTAGKLSDVVKALNKSSEINLGDTVDDSYTLSWEWALEQGEDDAKATNNVKDTAIGWKADGKTDDDIKAYLDTSVITEDVYNNNIETTMSFNLTISVEQIQTTSD